MKRSIFVKTVTFICWILLIINLIGIIKLNKWYSYMGFISSLLVISMSYKTYKRKIIALFLLSLKFISSDNCDNFSITAFSGFCALLKFHGLNSNFINCIKPEFNSNNFNTIKGISLYESGYWFQPRDWSKRTNYLKTILKE